MGYARKSKSMRKSTRFSRARPALLVKTKSRKVQVARKSRVDGLARAVRSLKMAKYGSIQVQRQSFRSTTGGNESFQVSKTRPAAFCLEAICIGNEVYSTQTDAADLYTWQSLGVWIQQPFPPTVLNPANSQFDLQEYRNSKNQGVASTYFYRGSSIDIQIFATSVNGYLHCYIVKPRISVTRVVDQERKLPFSMPCFVNMGEGCDALYDHSSQFFSIKKKWSRYINTIPGDATNRYLQTNNLMHKRMWCPAKKLITGSDIAGINLVGDQDIATRKQSWLMFTFTANATSLPASNLRIQVQRTVHWADSLGSK